MKKLLKPVLGENLGEIQQELGVSTVCFRK